MAVHGLIEPLLTAARPWGCHYSCHHSVLRRAGLLACGAHHPLLNEGVASACRPVADFAEPAPKEAASPVERTLPANFGELSYSKQHDYLFASMPLDVRKAVPKPSPEAQRVRFNETLT